MGPAVFIHDPYFVSFDMRDRRTEIFSSSNFGTQCS